MTPVGLLLAAAVSVAFPRAGQVFEPASRSYAIGSASPDVTNVVVNGVSVRPYRTGAWAVLVPATDGENRLVVVGESSGGNVTSEVVYAVKPRVRTYSKLSYAKDSPGKPPTDVPAENLIYIDPGHGGTDTGAVSPHGWFEKDANLALARAVTERLRALGYRVKMTREDDRAVELYERARAAHAEGAQAFVSIHHNAPAADADPQIRFSGVYCWNALGDPLARAIATRLARTHEDEFPSKGVLRANFAVTRSPEIPSCLVEADFITSPVGEEDLFDPDVTAYRGAAIADGIDDWCKAARLRCANSR